MARFPLIDIRRTDPGGAASVMSQELRLHFFRELPFGCRLHRGLAVSPAAPDCCTATPGAAAGMEDPPAPVHSLTAQRRDRRAMERCSPGDELKGSTELRRVRHP